MNELHVSRRRLLAAGLRGLPACLGLACWNKNVAAAPRTAPVRQITRRRVLVWLVASIPAAALLVALFRAYGVGVAGPVQTRTFLVRTRHNLPVVSLVTKPANLWDSRRGIYVKGPHAAPKAPFEGANFWRNWERPVHVEFFEPDGRLGFAQDMGMKIHGGHSRAAAQKSLAL